MACISAETGTLTFAIINLVLVLISSVSGLCLMAFWMVLPYIREESIPPNVVVSQLAAIMTLLISSLVSLVFASFLMNGILKKKPEHLKVYYIFGVVKMVLTLFIFITASVVVGVPYYGAVIFVLAIYSVYSLILYMIRYTYVQYEVNQAQFGHKSLVEEKA